MQKQFVDFRLIKPIFVFLMCNIVLKVVVQQQDFSNLYAANGIGFLGLE